MINQHNGRRLNEKSGKEYLPKQKDNINHSKKANKKYRCNDCNKKLPIYALVEQPPNKHGRVFICYKCLKGDTK